MAQTTLLYLADTFQFDTETTITASGEDDDGPYVVTDATVFYPGGGGQEPDKGHILRQDGSAIVVSKAILKKGTMHHYLAEHDLQTGDQVRITIDSEYRLQNAKLHTGGHLLSAVIYEQLGLPLVPVKGFHYQQGAYVEFAPQDENMPAVDPDELHRAVQKDIAGQLPVTATIVSTGDAAYAEAFKPEDFVPPEDKPLRLVRIGAYRPIPCGGTHLRHTGELKSLAVKHIKHKKGNIRISYHAG